MIRLSLLVFLFLSCYHVTAQEADSIKDHKYYLNILGNAKDSLYGQVLSTYNRYAHRHPGDFKTQIERCRFIQNAYYDSYEDYNPKGEEAETCAQQLLTAFPEEPEVRIYMNDFLFGDSSIAYLEGLNSLIEEDPERWRDYDWIVYKELAQNYDFNEDYKSVIRYGKLATDENDTLDLSLLLAGAHKNLSQRNQAIEVLVNNLDSTNLAWELNQKGRLLLELGVPEKAIEAFQLAATADAETEDMSSLAQAMIDNGLIAEARDYLLKNYKRTSWNPSMSLQKLLEYDLSYGSADSAAFSYQRFVDINFWNDPLGVYRMRLFAKSPMQGWSFADTGRVILMLAALLLLFVIPYTWVLPIHYFGALQKARGKVFEQSTFQWGLRHFWVACSLWLTCDFMVTIILDYPAVISYFNDDIGVEVVEPISLVSANFMLVFCTGCAAFTIPFLRKQDVLNFFSRFYGMGREILTGVGLAFLLRFCFVFYQRILTDFGVSMNSASSTIASVSENILSVNTFYHPVVGFLFVVLLVPFYEEILFRGIFLSACERNMKFVFANILQSLVFALVHNELKLIPFYFAFGMIAGAYRRKTQSLTVGTSMHVTNNLFAFLVLLARG